MSHPNNFAFVFYSAHDENDIGVIVDANRNVVLSSSHVLKVIDKTRMKVLPIDRLCDISRLCNYRVHDKIYDAYRAFEKLNIK